MARRLAALEAFQECFFRLKRALSISVISQSAAMERLADPHTGVYIIAIQRADNLFAGANHDDFVAGLKALIDSRPVIAEQARAGAGHFKHARGRGESEI